MSHGLQSLYGMDLLAARCSLDSGEDLCVTADSELRSSRRLHRCSQGLLCRSLYGLCLYLASGFASLHRVDIWLLLSASLFSCCKVVISTPGMNGFEIPFLYSLCDQVVWLFSIF